MTLTWPSISVFYYKWPLSPCRADDDGEGCQAGVGFYGDVFHTGQINKSSMKDIKVVKIMKYAKRNSIKFKRTRH